MIKKILYTLLATITLAVGVIAFGLQTERVQNWIAVEIKIQTHERTGWNLSFSQFSWTFPFHFTLKDIVLDDLKGNKIHIDHASGTVNPVALLRNYILIHDVDISYQEWNIMGTVRGNPNANTFASNLTVTSSADPDLLMSVKAKLRDLKGSLELSGEWNQLDGQISGQMSWDGSQFQYTDLTGNVEDYEVSGSVSIDSKLNFDGSKVILKHPEGSGSFILAGPYEALRVQFDLTIPTYQELSWIHFKGDLFHNKTEIQTQFNTSFSFSDHRYYTDTSLSWSPQSPLRLRTNGRDDKGMLFDGDFTTTKENGYALNINAEKGAFFNELRLKAVLPNKEDKDWTYTLGVKAEAFAGEFKGTAQVSADAQVIEATAFSGIWKGHQMTLIDPFTLEHQHSDFKLTPLFMTLDSGTVYTTIDYIQDNVHIAARLVDLPIILLPVFEVDFPAQATFNGNFFLFGPIDHLGGQAQLELPKILVKSNSLATIPPLEGKINANLFDDNLELTGFFSGISSTPITLEASIPLVLSLHPLSIEVYPDRPFSTKLNYDGPVGPITELITSETAPLKGDLALEVELVGSFANPQITGSGSFRNGSYESADLGVIFKNIKADFKGSGDHIDITHIAAGNDEDGFITGSGTLNTSLDKKFSFDFDLLLDDTKLVRIDWMKANASGNLKFFGDTSHATLSGDLKTNALKVTIPEGKSANIKTVPVTYINQSLDEPGPTILTTIPINWPLDLDVKIEAQRGSVSGDNFNTTWGGDVHAKGTLQDPLLDGKMRVLDGNYRFNGRPFEITQGTITFGGDPISNTNLYVVAEQDLGEITAEVVLRGMLDNPELSLRSKPALPQREVLSWILFGRGTSEINPIENKELTKSISELNTGGSQNALSRLRNRIGIDLIDINRDITGETDEMSIQVGKYISKGVLVSVNKGINNEANRVGIEAKISHNIKVEAEVGDNAEGHLFLKWKRDY